MITVDCGIRSPVEVAHGQALGLDMIVTDHHSIQLDADGRDLLPPALAVINPKQQADHYPFRDFAGVGLAFKLAQALLLAEQREPILPAPPALEERDLLDLVALGTVADLAPLLGENRSLVQRGLAELNKPRRPGIQAMLEEAKVAPGKVDATAIGFVLGPRINAAGRLKHAKLSYDLLTAPDTLTARPLAEELAALNRERQNLTLAKVELAQQQIAADRDGAGIKATATSTWSRTRISSRASSGWWPAGWWRTSTGPCSWQRSATRKRTAQPAASRSSTSRPRWTNAASSWCGTVGTRPRPALR